MRDVARIELAARDYNMDSMLEATERVRSAFPAARIQRRSKPPMPFEAMEELKARFPEGMEYTIVFDTTVFVRESIHAVLTPWLEAMVLVVLVVVLFLQKWRASIIPLCAVPVSLIGTLAVMHALGFSLNNLSLFGLVLAIGIVVDDAIVVVENVERNIGHGLSPARPPAKPWTRSAGRWSPLPWCFTAVFRPTAFMSGITGQFYSQFALTIAVSTLISAFNSLT